MHKRRRIWISVKLQRICNWTSALFFSCLRILLYAYSAHFFPFWIRYFLCWIIKFYNIFIVHRGRQENTFNQRWAQGDMSPCPHGPGSEEQMQRGFVDLTSSFPGNDHFFSHVKCLSQKSEENFIINKLYSMCSVHFAFKFCIFMMNKRSVVSYFPHIFNF